MFKKLIVLLVLMTIFFASSWSFFRSDFFYVHDFTHGARIVEMHKALTDGHFPVRWSSDLGFGYGMPLFEFYAPLPYYVGAFFYAIGFSLIDSIKLLFLISSLVTLIGSYKLGKIVLGNSGGLLIAAAMTLAPYRAVNLFVRGAVSELWGIMVLPFILYGIIQVIRKNKKGWLTLLFSLLVLLLSHNLTTLIFLPLSLIFGGVYLLLYSSKEKNGKKFFVKNLAVLAGTYLLSILISSFYLLPAFMEKSFTRLESAIIGGNYFDYNLHFLYIKQFFETNWKYGGSSWGPYDDMSFYLGTGQLIALGLTMILFVKSILKNAGGKGKKIISSLSSKDILYLSSLFLLGLSMFMSIGRSKFIWDSLGLLSFIQFPWRWLSASIIFLSITIGFLVKFTKTKFHRYLFSGVIILIIIFSNWKFFQPEKFVNDNGEFYYSSAEKIREEMSQTLPDYIPAQMQGTVLEPVAYEGDLLGCEVWSNCDFEFSKLIDKTHKKSVEVNLPTQASLEFAVANFPGWTAEVDGTIVKTGVSEFGTILVPVEPGKHKVSLEFKNSEVRSVADGVSLFGLVIFLGIFFWYYKNNE